VFDAKLANKNLFAWVLEVIISSNSLEDIEYTILSSITFAFN